MLIRYPIPGQANADEGDADSPEQQGQTERPAVARSAPPVLAAVLEVLRPQRAGVGEQERQHGECQEAQSGKEKGLQTHHRNVAVGAVVSGAFSQLDGGRIQGGDRR
jgi:hypothetical protein